MSIAFGSRQMQSAGRAITCIALVVLAVSLCALIFSSEWMGRHQALMNAGGPFPMLGSLVPLYRSLTGISVVVSLGGGALWFAGWLLEGFARNEPS